jgi:hypothetical protein
MTLDHEIDLLGEEILHRRAVATVWHELEFGPGLLLK